MTTRERGAAKPSGGGDRKVRENPIGVFLPEANLPRASKGAPSVFTKLTFPFCIRN
jgi:hypothetical protein